MDEWYEWYEDDEDDEPGLWCCPSCGRLAATGETCPECRSYAAEYDALVAWKEAAI